MNVEASNTDSGELIRIFAIRNGKFQVIVQEKIGLLTLAGIATSLRSTEADGISSNGIVQFLAPHQDRQAVQLKLDTILAFDKFSQPTQFLSFQTNHAHGRTRPVALGVNVKRRGFHVMSLQSGTKVLSHSLSLSPFRLDWQRTSWQIVKFVWHLGLFRFHQIRIDPHLFSGHVLLRRHAREQDLRQRRLLLTNESFFLLVP
mmetsp:Transcript_16421/g.29448  ORF Transcript_16421/g.29448 Transcript_16421/m.29448 type:complete len:202 (-) Transcript_16421:464-1069(-)